MNTEDCVAVLGGDERQVALARYLKAEGLTPLAFGLPKERLSGMDCFEDWHEAVKNARAVILPLPVSADGKHLHQPLQGQGEKVEMADIFSAILPQTPILGGNFSPALKEMAERAGKRLVDYFECEELKWKNALLTAEGAIAILMREIPRAVCGLPVLVTGYGRIAKHLARLLSAMGARVTVCARKRSDVQAAADGGCETVLLQGAASVMDAAKGKTVIFNTVPHWLFTREVLEVISKETLIVDLASAPGGVDADAAAKRGVRVIFALSLPGKYAPVSAGEMIAQTVMMKLDEEGSL